MLRAFLRMLESLSPSVIAYRALAGAFQDAAKTIGEKR